MPDPERFRFRPRRPMVAAVAALLGLGLVASALLDAPLPGTAIATGAGGMALGAAVAALALVYLLSPAWKTVVVADDAGLQVETSGGRGFQLPWTDVVRVVAVPARAAAFIDGGTPRRSLLLPGAGARGAYRIEGQARLLELVRQRVPADRVVEVPRLKASYLPAATPAAPADPADGPTDPPQP